MESLNMFLVKFLLFALTFYGHFVDLDALTCPKGHKVKKMSGGKSTCEPCRDGFYQPTENYKTICMICTTCHTTHGSEIKEMCTKETDTKCGCRAGFVLLESDSSVCKCDAGSGLRYGTCSPCEDGSFTSRIDSPCQKWKECKSGVNTTGTRTKDVICNAMSNPGTTADVTSAPRRPQEETRPHTAFATISSTISPPTVATTPKEKPKADPPAREPNTGNHIGVVILIFGIVGLLLLIAVTCKLHVAPNVQRKQAEPIKDSLCRRPVMESGDSSELSVKLNVGDP